MAGSYGRSMFNLIKKKLPNSFPKGGCHYIALAAVYKGYIYIIINTCIVGLSDVSLSVKCGFTLHSLSPKSLKFFSYVVL